MKSVQIQDTRLIRDVHSKAILNTDSNALNDYLMKKEIAKKQQEEKQKMNERLNNLEQNMEEIKNLLLKIAVSQDK